MTDEDKQELRAMMLEVSSAVADSMRRQVVEELRLELKPISRQMTDLQADVSSCLDRLDLVEVKQGELLRKFERLENSMTDVKTMLVKTNREQMRDRSARDTIEKRLDRLDAGSERVERKP